MSQADAHLSSANEQTSGVGRQPVSMTRSVATVKTRPLRVRFGCGHHACKAAGLADDVQAITGHGRSRHRADRRTGGESLRKRVNNAHNLHNLRPPHTHNRDSNAAQLVTAIGGCGGPSPGVKLPAQTFQQLRKSSFQSGTAPPGNCLPFTMPSSLAWGVGSL